MFSIHSLWGSVFILTQSVIKEIDEICRAYLWGSFEDKNKIKLLVWDKDCVPKKSGALNIKGDKFWNVASVGKVLWQLIVRKDVLWSDRHMGVYESELGHLEAQTPTR